MALSLFDFGALRFQWRDKITKEVSQASRNPARIRLDTERAGRRQFREEKRGTVG